ncbi:MAG TPA: cyclopropane-fatty-acyl-phospholipid synthase family protein [Acidimicrobiia bacterium]|nr:cyclopropane-fatty-acyl-phospholipid synthase family protein [Acidimicrobiia bacterium]
MEATEVSRLIYRRLVDLSSGPPPALRLWTGERLGPSSAAATLVLNHPGSWRSLLVPPDNLTAAEAYLYDDVDVEGDMVALMEFLAGLEPLTHRWVQLLRLVGLARKLPSDLRRRNQERPDFGAGALHSLSRDERAVTFHYDTGNEFFKLFLDPQLVYSCADFLDPTEPLAVAQERKLDLICRKLELAPGQGFLDVGCGWGSLVIHAASRYGVHATGVTLSEPQASVAEIRAKEAGVEDRVTIIRDDYRSLEGTYDAIASVGMFEHVGRSELSDYFSFLSRRLVAGGQLLNHGIVTRRRGFFLRRPTFISTYVFPDSQLVPIEEVVGAAEGAGFELRDAESLRTSYAATLRHWVANLENNAAAAIDLVGERIYRIWRLYMAGSVTAFENAQLSVFQLLLADPDRSWAFGRRRLLASDDI